MLETSLVRAKWKKASVSNNENIVTYLLTLKSPHIKTSVILVTKIVNAMDKSLCQLFAF